MMAVLIGVRLYVVSDSVERLVLDCWCGLCNWNPFSEAGEVWKDGRLDLAFKTVKTED